MNKIMKKVSFINNNLKNFKFLIFKPNFDET